jgi:hypothetical protein
MILNHTLREKYLRPKISWIKFMIFKVPKEKLHQTGLKD